MGHEAIRGLRPSAPICSKSNSPLVIESLQNRRPSVLRKRLFAPAALSRWARIAKTARHGFEEKTAQPPLVPEDRDCDREHRSCKFRICVDRQKTRRPTFRPGGFIFRFQDLTGRFFGWKPYLIPVNLNVGPPCGFPPRSENLGIATQIADILEFEEEAILFDLKRGIILFRCAL